MADSSHSGKPDKGQESTHAGPTRRNWLWEIGAGVIATVVGIGPLLAGLTVFLDPIFRRKEASGEEETPGTWLRITSLDSVPADGTPAQFPVLNDLVDAWNREANQPVGAVFLSRSDGGVRAFNAICPHAGCFVSFAKGQNVYLCPCHNSAFELDGAKVEGTNNPSPRPMDSLEVDEEKLAQGEVWVKFVNYYPAKHEQEPKP